MTSISKTYPSVNFPGQQEQLSGELYLSTIGDTFDETRDIALSPHCFLGREDVLPDWWDYPFIDPFPDAETVVNAKKNIQALVYWLLPGIVDDDRWRTIVSQTSILQTQMHELIVERTKTPQAFPVKEALKSLMPFDQNL